MPYFRSLPRPTRVAVLAAAFSVVLAIAMCGAALACRTVDRGGVAGFGTARVVFEKSAPVGVPARDDGTVTTTPATPPR